MDILADRYSLSSIIGEGAMGTVYRATDTVTQRPIAVKALNPQLVERDPAMVERFAREGDALRALNHPNIVKMLEAVADNGRYYLVMEYVEGGSLHGLLADERQLAVDRVLGIGLELADALTRAHHLGIVHRDLKPGNVMLASDGSVRLADFGIAHFIDHNTLTRTGSMLGTWSYMAPEAYTGQPLDSRSDVWSLGVMLYEMLAGSLPFDGPTPMALMNAVLTAPPADLHAYRPDAPDALADLVYRMLSKAPGERIPSMRHIGADLEDIGQVLGIQPHYASIRAAAARQVGGPPSIFQTPTPTSEKKHNLPHNAMPFVGRQNELSHISRMLSSESCQLLTVLGPGGMGKTRLGIAAAERQIRAYPDGVYFVPLAPLTDAGHIVPAVAQSIGFVLPGEEEPLKELLGFLANKHMLLVLDNFEHVLAGAPVVAEIIKSAPGVDVIITSRARLNLSGEHVYEIAGLEYPDHAGQTVFEEFAAVEMFTHYARRVRPGYTLSEDDYPAVVDICRLVDGMPLGLELASTWVQMLDPAEIAEELARDLDFLAAEMGDLPERQRSMRAAFDYSWNLLDAREQQALQKLSVFRGGASRNAAQAVSGASLPVLVNLTNKSMVRRDPESGRFEIHELMRQFAAEKLDETGEADAVRDAHCAFYAAGLDGLEAQLKGHRQLETVTVIAENIENIRAAWRWALDHQRYEPLAQMLSPLYLYCEIGQMYPFGLELFETAEQTLRGDGDAPGWLLGRVLSRLGMFLVRNGTRGKEAPPLAEEALVLARAAGDQKEEWMALNTHGYSLTQEFLRGSLPILEEALAVVNTAPEADWEQALALHNLAIAYIRQDNHQRYIELTEAALSLRRELGDQWGMFFSLHNLTGAYTWRSEFDSARAHLEEMSSLPISRYFPGWQLWIYTRKGSLALWEGDLEKAFALASQSIRLAQDHWGADKLADAHLGKAYILHWMERYEEQKAEYENVRALFDIIDERFQYNVKSGECQILLRTGQPEAAWQPLYEVYLFLRQLFPKASLVGEAADMAESAYYSGKHHSQAREIMLSSAGRADKVFDPVEKQFALYGLAFLHLMDNEPAQAARLLGALCQDHVVLGFEKLASVLLEHMRGMLPQDAIDAAVAEGKSLDIDEALTETLASFEGRQGLNQ